MITAHRQFVEAQTHVAVRGLRYAYRRLGAGLPVLCLHGLMDSSASFAALAAALRTDDTPTLDIIAPDWRGHGDSQCTPGDYWFPNYLADLEALVDALAIEQPVVLIGHSMGGQVASLFAGLRPERVAALITLDSLNVPDSDPAEAPARYRDWLNARRDASPGKTPGYEQITDLVARLGRRYPELTEAQRCQLAEQWLTPADNGCWRLRLDPDHRRRMPYGFRAAEAKAIWREVACPVLCIDGGDSPATNWVAAKEMADRRACFADLTHRRLDGCGHMLHIQAPQAVAGLIRGFFDSIEHMR